MRRNRPPRSPLQRFAIISVALATVLLGYYLGNRYQFGELQNSAALVYEQPIEFDIATLPQPLRGQIENPDHWIILLPGETGAACDRLLEHFVEVINRLAAWPAIQQRVHLVLLETDQKPASLAWQSVPWASVQSLSATQMLELTSQLGIAPTGTRWCQDVQATAALLGPANLTHALLPLDKPADIAESLRLVIETFDPDV
jgi:hypothetical protein